MQLGACLRRCFTAQAFVLTAVVMQAAAAQTYVDHSDLDHTQRERAEVVKGAHAGDAIPFLQSIQCQHWPK